MGNTVTSQHAGSRFELAGCSVVFYMYHLCPNNGVPLSAPVFPPKVKSGNSKWP